MEREAFAAALKNVKLAGFVWPDPEDPGDRELSRMSSNVVAT